MNKYILTIALLFFILFMISCSAEKHDIEDETHTDTIDMINSAANINKASDYIFLDEQKSNGEVSAHSQTVTPSQVPTTLVTDTESNITEPSSPTEDFEANQEDKFKGLYTSTYDKIPSLEAKILSKEAEEAKKAKKEQEEKHAKEQATKKEKKKQGTIISSFKTFFNAANKPRVSNIKKAAGKLNGAVVKPGQVFSFNKYVGPTGEGNGYKAATVIVKGQETKGFGGGVCQVSSTLFNACEEAGLEILERHSHSKKVPYLPEGRDAAISYGGIDFKFKNTKDYTVRIKTHFSNGTIAVSVEKV